MSARYVASGAHLTAVSHGGRMDILTGLTLAAPAGLNAYIPLLVLGIAARFDVIELTGPYTFLEQWWMLALMAVLLRSRSSPTRSPPSTPSTTPSRPWCDRSPAACSRSARPAS